MPHTTTHPAGHDTRGHPILWALTLYPSSGQLTLYGPMRSRAYSALHARAKRLGHAHGSLSQSVASELQRAAREGSIDCRVLIRGTPAADRHHLTLTTHPGDLAGWAETLETSL